MELLQRAFWPPCTKPSNIAVGTSVFGEGTCAEARCTNVFCFNFLFTRPILDFSQISQQKDQGGWWHGRKMFHCGQFLFLQSAVCVHVDGKPRDSVASRSGWGGHAAPQELGWSGLCLSVLWEDVVHTGSCPAAACWLTWPHWGHLRSCQVSISRLHNALLYLPPRMPTLTPPSLGCEITRKSIAGIALLLLHFLFVLTWQVFWPCSKRSLPEEEAREPENGKKG